MRYPSIQKITTSRSRIKIIIALKHRPALLDTLPTKIGGYQSINCRVAINCSLSCIYARKGFPHYSHPTNSLYSLDSCLRHEHYALQDRAVQGKRNEKF